MERSRLISRVALAVIVLVRRCFARARPTNRNRILDLVILGEVGRELRSTDWFDLYGSCRPGHSQWQKRGELTTTFSGSSASIGPHFGAEFGAGSAKVVVTKE